MRDEELEKLVLELNNLEQLEAYKKPFDNYKVSFLPRILGALLVGAGNIVYGFQPSYLKFRAVEVIARVPYHSWESAAYTLLTRFYSNEKKALDLSKITQFSRLAQDNETMHVVVISQFAQKEQKAGILRYTFIPLCFALFYFWAAYWLYLVSPRRALELNYLFEEHAFKQYDQFIKNNEEVLKKKPAMSDFLEWYGRHPRNQYEFFLSVRNDEIVHRNRSICEIELNQRARC